MVVNQIQELKKWRKELVSFEVKLSNDKSYITLKIIGDLTSEQALKQDLEAHALGRKPG